ncbi:glycoside hydrolase family 2 protein [Saccharomonospora sp. NB11]|jgi:hypothetical protein|uniref:glycoside hydrolase family 2 protein n=1 Tax=Saccharomonospora sp. NB11 TaxID=1642298 RepID=UPI0018D0700D|nr:sugar-binding domain-containing protein [Saccharomonospora sp. NB11]
MSAEAKPAAATTTGMSTPWTYQVNSDNAHPEHPRPHLTRPSWRSLNGLWDYVSRDASGEVHRGERILVPYPPESLLSGIGRRDEQMWYRRTFDVPPEWRDGRVLLHFGAVDQIATVWVNHQLLIRHEGGFTSFTVDVTDVLRPDAEQEVLVRADDEGNRGTFAVGKQANQPGGILYTGCSGIWQSVWLEAVPTTHVADLDLVPDLRGLDLVAHVAGEPSHVTVDVSVAHQGEQVASARGDAGQRLRLDVPDPLLWSPDHPHLYDVTVRLLGDDGTVLDEVQSYTALRTIRVGRPEDAEGGTPARILLNDRPIFLNAPLDQGYWPDGVYTAPTDEALRFDLERVKALGFNSVRKHVKVEPMRWYHWADRLGLLVWQDMPSLPVVLDNPPGPQPPPVAVARERFEAELHALLHQLRNVPSLGVWVVFNEGWGEYDTARITEAVKAADPTRVVVAASGVNCCHSHPDTGAGDVYDDHTYVGPGRPVLAAEDERAAVDGEFGGIGLVVEGHTWPGEPIAYEMVADRDRLTERYVELTTELEALARDRLSGAVYTQVTDVENEVNGLLTYDRRVVKVAVPVVAERNRAVIAAGSGD